MNRLDNRESKVIRLLNYMIKENNESKMMQCVYIQTLIAYVRKRDAEIQERRHIEMITKRQEYLKSV